MRIKIIRTPTLSEVDGIRLDLFEPDGQYEVGNVLGALFLSEGWAIPVDSTEPAKVTPLSELAAERDAPDPRNLIREVWPHYFEGPVLAADRCSRSRNRHT